jgi:hypothetical protein
MPLHRFPVLQALAQYIAGMNNFFNETSIASGIHKIGPWMCIALVSLLVNLVLFRNFRNEVRKTAAMSKHSCWNYFDRNGIRLPKLVHRITRSSSSVSKGYETVLKRLIESADFGILVGDELLTREERARLELLTSSILTHSQLPYATEYDIQRHCTGVLEDVIRCSIELSNCVELLNELVIASSRSDIWVVVTRNGIPVGVIEIKKPREKGGGVDPMESQTNKGQLLSYMYRLRHYFGIREVFGIISTYEGWQICWLPEADAIAGATSLFKGSSDFDVMAQAAPADSLEGVMHASRVYRFDDFELPQVLLSVLKKMHWSCEHRDPTFVSVARSHCLTLTESRYTWGRLKAKTLSLYDGGSKESAPREFSLLRSLKGGSTCQTWLAADKEGRIKVVKLFLLPRAPSRKENKEEWEQQVQALKCAVEQELSYWLECGFSLVYDTVLDNSFALILPMAICAQRGSSINPHYNFRGGAENLYAALGIEMMNEFAHEASKCDAEVVLRQCIGRMASKCLIHDDIAWRHVAVFPEFSVVKKMATRKSSRGSSQASDEKSVTLDGVSGMFIDLGRVSRSTSAAEAEDAMLRSCYMKGMLIP